MVEFCLQLYLPPYSYVVPYMCSLNFVLTGFYPDVFALAGKRWNVKSFFLFSFGVCVRRRFMPCIRQYAALSYDVVFG